MVINKKEFASLKVPANPENSFKCRLCTVCNGWGCIGQLPGLGGVNNNKNFQLNCAGWKNLRKNNPDDLKSIESIKFTKDNVRCGPVTGAVQNIGYKNESDFYLPYFMGCKEAGIGICVGDGYPDEKLQLGFEAVNDCKTDDAAFFLKPYPLEILKKRVELVKDSAKYIGMDIDSYNILTMRNLCNLEKKDTEKLTQFKNLFPGRPFILKGVFTKDDIELVKELRPDIVYISNHGGRIETREGDTASFLYENGKELKNYCKELWVDGGIRTALDIKTAMHYGADKVIIARPFLKALFIGGQEALTAEVKKLFE